jgi:hypothetical protein
MIIIRVSHEKSCDYKLDSDLISILKYQFILNINRWTTGKTQYQQM